MTAQLTHINLKNESFLNEETNPYWLDPINVSASERKCGEIILLSNSNFWFICTFCDERFHSVFIFQNHIKDVHISDKLNYPHSHNKVDPLGFPQIQPEYLIKTEVDAAEDWNIKFHNCFILDEATKQCHIQEDTNVNQSEEIIPSQTKATINKECQLQEEIENDNCEKFSIKVIQEKEPSDCKDIEDLLAVPNKVPKKQNRKKKVYSCSFCPHVARDRRCLEGHLRTYHDTGTRFQCEECGKCFRNGSNLKTHLIIHSGTRPYKCDSCNAGFSHPNNLKTHRYIHTGERPYKCNQCDKGFVSSSGFKTHMLEHTGETPFVCDVCGRGFTNKCHYNRHMISHTGRRDYICKQCDKAFKHRETLTKHLACHTNEKNFICDVCPNRFTHRKNLVQHKKIHSDVKQYICKLCEKDFAQYAGLYSHMKHHKNKN